MQELVIDRVEEKHPRSGGKPFYVVYGQNGEEITDFNPAFKDFGKGTRINYEPKIDGSHTNFAKWELIEAAPGGNGGPPVPSKSDTEGTHYEYQLKARLQATEQDSIDTRTAFNGIVELVKADKLELSDPKAVKALEWASDRIPATSDPKQTNMDLETGAGEPIFDPKAPFPNIGALLLWCSKLDPPISQAGFLKIVGVKEEELPRVDIPTAYQLIKDHLAAKGAS